MNRPHSHKPFPEGFYDNSKLKKQHVFAFDILCRHLDTGEDNWIRTDSRTMISLFKKTAGLSVQVPKKLLSSLNEWGYIELIERESRTAYERVHNITFFEIQILPSAWDPKPVVRVYNAENRDEYMRMRYEKRKALLATKALES
jgi:hypothetical protein